MAQHSITLTLQASSPKELADKTQALQILAKNLDRDALVIIANKSAKPHINQTIKTYQHLL